MGKNFKFFVGIIGQFLRGIFACFGVLFAFFLLQYTQAVTMFVQQVGDP
jgi:hypothetical protein